MRPGTEPTTHGICPECVRKRKTKPPRRGLSEYLQPCAPQTSVAISTAERAALDVLTRMRAFYDRSLAELKTREAKVSSERFDAQRWSESVEDHVLRQQPGLDLLTRRREVAQGELPAAITATVDRAIALRREAIELFNEAMTQSRNTVRFLTQMYARFSSRQVGQRRGKTLRMCSCPVRSGAVVCRSIDGRLRGPRSWWGACSAAAGSDASC